MATEAVPESTEVLLGIGSNIRREYHLRAAIDNLRQRFGQVAISPVYESDAVGFQGDPFFNMVAAVCTTDSLATVNQWLKALEDQYGRDRSQPKFSSRRLDIDVLAWGEHSGIVSGIRLPRTEVFHHAFVLKPLADLRPQGKVPGEQRTWAELWAELDTRLQPLRKIDISLD